MLKWRYQNVCTCDILAYLRSTLSDLEDGDLAGVALGPKQGNILLKCVTEIDWPVDVIMSGPPCPPWATQGNRSDGYTLIRGATILQILPGNKSGSLVRM
jgi:hypothetical protein